MQDERGELITVTAAMAVMKCTRGAVCKILRKHVDEATGLSIGGRIEGRRVNPALWLVYRHTAEAAARDMAWCAGVRRGSTKPGRRGRKKAS
jgi:hypothetical protein